MRIIDYCNSLNVPIGTSHRGDCPLCGGVHSFGVTNTGLKLLWNCFRPDCRASGQKTAGLHEDSFNAPSGKDKDSLLIINDLAEPPSWVNLERSTEALDYLKRNGCWEFYLSTLSRFKYDLKQNRIVFKVWYMNRLVDAVGRNIDKVPNKGLPKWTRYGHSNVPFVTSLFKFRQAVIVEDAASACAVEKVDRAGVALLGTTLLSSHLKVLKENFDSVTVCLDKDASRKSLDMASELMVHLPTEIRILEKDLKMLTKEELQGVLK